MTIRHNFRRLATAVAFFAIMTVPALVSSQEIESYGTAREYVQKGSEYLGNGNAAVAQKHFERAAAMDKNDIAAQIGLCRAYKELGNFKEAEKYGKKALKIDGKSVDAYMAMGELFEAQIKRLSAS